MIFAAMSLTQPVSAAFDFNAVTISPMFLKPGLVTQVTLTMLKQFESTTGGGVYPVKMAAVFSRDSIWSADDILIVYNGSDGLAPVAMDTSKSLRSFPEASLFDGWADYKFTTIVPPTFLQGERWYIIFRGVEDSPWYETIFSVGNLDNSFTKQIAVPFEVAVNKDAIYNTAWANEKSASATYIISTGLPPATLIATPSNGNGNVYSFAKESLSVTLETIKTFGAKIYYTLDGSTPDSTKSPLYDSTKPIILTKSDTIKALAVVPGYTDANGVWYYIQTLPKATLTANPGDGTTYSTRSEIVKLFTDSGCKIYYTTDGTMPSVTNSAQLYDSTIGVTIIGSATIRAIAVGSGYISDTASFTYNCTLPQLQITATPASGTSFYFSEQISLFVKSNGVAVTGTKVYYSLTDPNVDSTNGTLYNGGVTISGNTTLYVVAYKDSNYVEGHATFVYTMSLASMSLIATPGTVGSPVFFGDSISVALSVSPDSAAVIKYNFDTTKSPLTGTVYSGAITIPSTSSDTIWINAVATAFGFDTVYEKWQYIRKHLSGVIATPGTSGFSDSVAVSLSLIEPWAGAVIWYTIDGSDPSAANHIVYSGAIKITATTTIKTFAVASNAIDGPESTYVYTQIYRVARGAYLDTSGDGAIDQLIMTCSKVPENLPTKVRCVSPFDSTEVVTASGSDISWIGSGPSTQIRVRLNPQFSFVNKTGFATDTFASVKSVGFATEAFDVADSVAPVIASAEYRPGAITSATTKQRAPDTLIVSYAENIAQDNGGRPFVMLVGGVLDTLVLPAGSDVSSAAGTVATYIVPVANKPSDSWFPSDGDSIWINSTYGTSDMLGNIQTNPDNRRVPLNVKPVPYLLIYGIQNPVSASSKIPDDLVDPSGQFTTGAFVLIDFSMDLKSAINAVQSSLKCKIYDVLGNLIGKTGDGNVGSWVLNPSQVSPSSRLVVSWNCRNGNNRNVSGGAYKVLISATDPDGRNISISGFICVQRK